MEAELALKADKFLVAASLDKKADDDLVVAALGTKVRRSCACVVLLDERPHSLKHQLGLAGGYVAFESSSGYESRLL
jgi:hypothetical protein